jgi:formate dehydrogenase subunit gamma
MTPATASHDASRPVTPLDPAAIEAIRYAIERHVKLPGALLPILHGIQDALGHVPPNAVPMIADALNLSRAEVHGVISFYHHFRSAPAGRRVLKLCRAEACQAMGARGIEAHLLRRLGVAFNETTPDEAWTLEPAYCFGNCACAPSAMIDGQLHGRLTIKKIDRLLDSRDEPA